MTHRYLDPLAQVWLGAARRIGLRIVRTPDAYAHTDGRGTLAIADDAQLDADDSLAQMIFHELCHSLVEGEASFQAEDWGMDNTGPDHDWREHGCLRLQWVLSGRYGLRALFAPTTDFRTTFWSGLAGDVLADRDDPSVRMAIAGLRRVGLPPWGPHLEQALAASATIAGAAAAFTTPALPGPPPLYAGVTAPPAPHPSGLPAGAGAGTCGTCAWRVDRRPDGRPDGRPEPSRAVRCRQAATRVDPAWPACERFEAALDCQTCGACCREAYHSVEVSARDLVRKRRPDYVVDRGGYLELRRSGERCSALTGGAVEAGRVTGYACVIYDDRPRTCRDFTLGSAHCLTARRRVGLSL